MERYKYRSPALPKPGNRGEAERLLTQGVQAQERNRLGEAIEAYRQAAKIDPTFFDAHYNCGVAAYEAGDLPQCLLAYEWALAINPVSVKARFNFAVALQKANYPRDAANELEKLLANNSSEARAHFALANLYAQQLDQPAKARDHYLRLLELEPQHPQATAVRYWLELLRWRSSRRFSASRTGGTKDAISFSGARCAWAVVRAIFGAGNLPRVRLAC